MPGPGQCRAGTGSDAAVQHACCRIAVIIAFTDSRPGMISAATGAMARVMVLLVKEHGLQYLLAATVLTSLLQIAAGEISSTAAIEADTIDRAAALVDHLDAWALGLHAEVAAGGVGDGERVVRGGRDGARARRRRREGVVLRATRGQP